MDGDGWESGRGLNGTHAGELERKEMAGPGIVPPWGSSIPALGYHHFWCTPEKLPQAPQMPASWGEQESILLVSPTQHPAAILWHHQDPVVQGLNVCSWAWLGSGETLRGEVTHPSSYNPARSKVKIWDKHAWLQSPHLKNNKWEKGKENSVLMSNQFSKQNKPHR